MGVLNKKGIDARRRILDKSIGWDQEISDLRLSAPRSAFYRAVVVEILNDLSQIDADRLADLKDSVVNPEFLTHVPRNSVIVRIVSNARDRKNSTPMVCYPFIPPHLSLPVKPGEQVWVMFENERVSTRLAYWLWRTPEPDHVDDLNYTHSDRKFDKSQHQTTSEKAEGSTDSTPGFQNGGGTAESRTLIGADDYETIVDDSVAYQSFTPESVPRFTKRPGDLVLQGSNNTLIVLGEDRTASATKTPEEQKSGAGTIDVVAGRGRFQPEPGATAENTAAPTIVNSRNDVETDKNTSVTGGTSNDAEGDPDFARDASRLLLSMNTDGDANFNLEGNYPDPFDTDVESATESPYAFLKSDHVRIIARKDDENNINGSLHLVKEGKVGEDQVAILMLSDGTMRIDANTIFLGRPGGNGPGPGGSEPYIKFSSYKSQIEELIGIVSDLLTVFASTFTLPDPPMTGGPSPSLTTALSSPKGVSDAITSLAALKAKLDEAQSSRIYGE